jgi:hypothetical protein
MRLRNISRVQRRAYCEVALRRENNPPKRDGESRQMSVRKRTWITAKGEAREAWIVDYADVSGRRHIKSFIRKKDADAYEAKVRIDIRAGVHIAPSQSFAERLASLENVHSSR